VITCQQAQVCQLFSKACPQALGTKKRRVQKDDAPSNRTFGNCLLGIHSNQNDRPGTRANAAFPAVAGCQHEKTVHSFSTDVLTTAWTQLPSQISSKYKL
jgi:hypothetical protein